MTFGTIVVHELVHGITFAAFGGSPRYGFKIKYLLPLAYATSPGDRFKRNKYILIALAPLVVIDVVCLILLAIFPQAYWLAWVIVFNTAGAIGDIWMVAQLLRCPQSIKIEDRAEGMAIYAPSSVSLQKLPFRRTEQRRPHYLTITWLNTSLKVFLLLVCLGFLLIPIMKILEVPSFVVGTEILWFFRWYNTKQGFGIVIQWGNLFILLIALFLIGLLFYRFRKKS
jgi:hypothetical protein